MGQITKAFAELMIEAAEKGHHTPLTAWEQKQFAQAWLTLNAAPPPLSPPDTGNVGAQLLTDAEAKSLQELAEAAWGDLQKNKLGGYSGINRPFYLVWMFKTVIERYGRRDVGLQHSKNALDEAYERGRNSAALPPGRGMVPMTTAEIDLAVRNAQIAFALDKFKTFEEALVRKAEAHHGIKEGSATPLGDGEGAR